MSGYAGQVAGYLAYCKRAAAQLSARGSALDPKYHPTADGAARLIAHRGDTAEAKKIREAFRELAPDQSSRSPGRAAA